MPRPHPLWHHQGIEKTSVVTMIQTTPKYQMRYFTAVSVIIERNSWKHLRLIKDYKTCTFKFFFVLYHFLSAVFRTVAPTFFFFFKAATLNINITGPVIQSRQVTPANSSYSERHFFLCKRSAVLDLRPCDNAVRGRKRIAINKHVQDLL